MFLGTGNVMVMAFFQPPLLFCDTVVSVLGAPGNDFRSVKIDFEH